MVRCFFTLLVVLFFVGNLEAMTPRSLGLSKSPQDLRETKMGRKLRTFLIALTLLMVGAETAQASFFGRLAELERRKNAWLRSLFFRR
jgi:hypothetical protein